MFLSASVCFLILFMPRFCYPQSTCENGVCQIDPRPESSIITGRMVFGSFCKSGPSVFCDGRSHCCGGWTELGFLTAEHCNNITGAFRFPSLDIQLVLDRKPPGVGLPLLSTGTPHHFYDRRGYKVLLDYLDTEDGRHRTRGMFFPGESGSLVYDEAGRVCGVVSANSYLHSETWGEVASVALLLQVGAAQGRPAIFESRQRSDLRSACRSILEREAAEKARTPDTSLRQPTPYAVHPQAGSGVQLLRSGPLRFQLE